MKWPLLACQQNLGHNPIGADSTAELSEFSKAGAWRSIGQRKISKQQIQFRPCAVQSSFTLHRVVKNSPSLDLRSITAHQRSRPRGTGRPIAGGPHGRNAGGVRPRERQSPEGGGGDERGPAGGRAPIRPLAPPPCSPPWGKNLLRPARFLHILHPWTLKKRAVTSVVEHYLDTVGVTGSNPVSRTIPFF